MVEQLAFNQRVAGSSPARLTNLINEMRAAYVLPVSVLCACCVPSCETLPDHPLIRKGMA